MIAPPAAPAAAPTGPATTAPVAAPAAAPFPAGDLQDTKPVISNVNAANAISRYIFILVKTVLGAALGVSRFLRVTKRGRPMTSNALSRRNVSFLAVNVNVEPLTLDFRRDAQPDGRAHDHGNHRGSDDS
jgi:hypothetical protein